MTKKYIEVPEPALQVEVHNYYEVTDGKGHECYAVSIKAGEFVVFERTFADAPPSVSGMNYALDEDDAREMTLDLFGRALKDALGYA